MCAAALKKTNEGQAYPSAVWFFDEIGKVFALASGAKALHLSSERLRAALEALKDAPKAELATLNAVLVTMSSEISRIMSAGHGTVASEASAKVDAQFEKDLAAALARKPRPMATGESKTEAETFMHEFRVESAAALRSRIERKELITSAELQDALKISRQSVSDAVKSGRLFALVGPSGDNYYPAFYTDPNFDRRSLERVSKVLGTLPSASKYSFFTTKSHVLGTTPLDALKKGKLAAVLEAASGFKDR